MIISIREKINGAVAIVIVIIIAIPLAFLGLESLFQSSNRVLNVASVNGLDITELELLRQVETRRALIRQSLGEDNYKEGLFSDEQLRDAALKTLVSQRLLLSASDDLDMGISDEAMMAELNGIQQFQIDGLLSTDLLQSYVTQMGYTTAAFVSNFKNDLQVSQLTGSITSSSFATEVNAKPLIAINQESRDYKYIRLSLNSIVGDQQVLEDEVANFYELNQAQFSRPEKIKVNYLRLAQADFIAKVEIREEETKQRFDQQQSQSDEREVAHIQIDKKDDQSHLATIAEIKSELAAGADFAELAKTYSQDIGSASNGGYLGKTTGQSFPTEFEQAILTVSEGAVTDVVEIADSLHLIKLLDITKSSLNFADEKDRIESLIRSEKAQQLYQDAATEFSNAYLSAENLQEVVDLLQEQTSLSVQSSDYFQRDSGSGIATNERVRALAFSQPILQENQVSDAIEFSESEMLVIQLNDHQPAGTYTFEEVSNTISTQLKREKAAVALKQQAEAIQQELEGGADVQQLAKERGLNWQVQLDQRRLRSAEINQQAFDLKLTGEYPLFNHAQLSDGDYIVLRLESAKQGDWSSFSEIEQSVVKQQLSRQLAERELLAYVNTLRESADLDVSIDTDQKL